MIVEGMGITESPVEEKETTIINVWLYISSLCNLEPRRIFHFYLSALEFYGSTYYKIE